MTTPNTSSPGLITVGTPEEKQHAELSLQQFMEECSGATGAMVATSDGFVIAASFKTDVAMRSLAAITSSIMSLAESLAKETKHGACHNLVIEAESGNAISLRVNRTRILTVMAEHHTRLGMLLNTAKRCTERLANVSEDTETV